MKHSPADIERIKQNCDLVSIIGAKVNLKRQGSEWVGLCPFHAEGTPSFYVIPKKRIYHCFGCSVTGDVFGWLKQVEGLDFVDALKRLDGACVEAKQDFVPAKLNDGSSGNDAEEQKKKIEKARKIWDESQPASGTLVERYLASRGLGGVMIPSTIRFHTKLWNAEVSALMPCMVAAVTDARQKIVGVHRTYLRNDGNGKADVKQPKKMLGACRGAHVVLGLPAQGKLVVAEGIETAMSIMKAKPSLGVWAALSLGNMDAPVPNGVIQLTLCADGDNKDQRAADSVLEAAVRRHIRSGRIVRIARPAAGKDFNDMIRGA